MVIDDEFDGPLEYFGKGCEDGDNYQEEIFIFFRGRNDLSIFLACGKIEK